VDLFHAVGTGEFQAIADPLIEIDPSFPYRDSFSLVFSENLVPEPSSARLIALIGVLALGRARALARMRGSREGR
jgi:hypothetical protein